MYPSGPAAPRRTSSLPASPTPLAGARCTQRPTTIPHTRESTDHHGHTVAQSPLLSSPDRRRCLDLSRRRPPHTTVHLCSRATAAVAPVRPLPSQWQLHGEQHLPRKHQPTLRHPPQERLLQSGPLRHGQRRLRPGHRLRARPVPWRRQRLLLRELRGDRVPGRAEGVPTLQGRLDLLRPLPAPLLQPQLLPGRRQFRHRVLPRGLPGGEQADGRVRRRRPPARQHHRWLRSRELVQEVRHGGGGFRWEQPQDLRAGAVHAGQDGGLLPGLFWPHY